jgi:hypothetical protein
VEGVDGVNVYIYQAALYCEDCGRELRRMRKTAAARGGKPVPTDPDDESSYDSDDYPKGPYPNGGGESDCPQHCANMGDCANTPDGKAGVFLENPLTSDGVEYVKQCLADDEGTGSTLAQQWAKFYGIEV